MKIILKRAIADGRGPYLSLLDWRNTPNERLGYSPAQLLLGRRTRTLLPMTAQLLDSAVSSPEIRDKIIEAKIDQKKYHDRTARDRSREHVKLIEGQKVRVKLNDKNEWRKAQISEKLPQCHIDPTSSKLRTVPSIVEIQSMFALALNRPSYSRRRVPKLGQQIRFLRLSSSSHSSCSRRYSSSYHSSSHRRKRSSCSSNRSRDKPRA